MEVCGEHQQDFMDDNLCPYCEIARLTNEVRQQVLTRAHEAEARSARIAELEGALKELRIIFHASGRRPEECYEMSLIDDALMASK